MTVEDLIRELQKHPADTKVYVRGYEDGIDDVVGADAVKVRRDVNTEWWYGRHEVDGDLVAPSSAAEPGLWLRAEL